MVQQYCAVIIYCCLLFLPVFCDAIDEDYFYGPALRSKWLEYGICQKTMPSFLCRLDCYSNHICIDRKCWCIDKSSLDMDIDDLKNLFAKKDYENDFIDLTRGDSKVFIMGRPSLRHHIAHFCPNLDVARACIRKCMKEGKPAFCGKDHNCYCGHKYTSHDKNNAQDAKETYAQFQDMYEKYLNIG